MKLIFTFFSKKAMAIALLLLTALFSNARIVSSTGAFRVFWNKFEVASTNTNIVVLTWNVTEYNNKSFRVQHSVDGVEWKDIAIVQSKNSPESITDYSYTHINKLRGKQFYRLQDVDVDHESTGYSPVKTLVLKESNNEPSVSIWPNPATDRITIMNTDNANTYTKARIFDLTGKVVAERKLTTDTNEIVIAELPAGTYIVKIETNKGVAHSQKIVKQ